MDALKFNRREGKMSEIFYDIKLVRSDEPERVSKNLRRLRRKKSGCAGDKPEKHRHGHEWQNKHIGKWGDERKLAETEKR